MTSFKIFGSAFYLFILSFTNVNVATHGDPEWNKLENEKFTLYYTNADKNNIEGLHKNLLSGINHINEFFQHSFRSKFDVYVFPNRASLDKQWQKDWNDSTFQSQCWMIASGVAHRLDILSTNAWPKEACDHNSSDTTEIRQVIWHELVHVFHGQNNPDHTFSYIEKLDWLVEGIATYVSGQLDEKRLQRVRQLIKDNKTPATLDDFWKGQEKYGLSGSMAGYIDKTYGRKKTFKLLTFTNKQDALRSLNVDETQLINDWKKSMQ
jgi:hypothetical protein